MAIGRRGFLQGLGIGSVGALFGRNLLAKKKTSVPKPDPKAASLKGPDDSVPSRPVGMYRNDRARGDVEPGDSVFIDQQGYVAKFNPGFSEGHVVGIAVETNHYADGSGIWHRTTYVLVGPDGVEMFAPKIEVKAGRVVSNG